MGKEGQFVDEKENGFEKRRVGAEAAVGRSLSGGRNVRELKAGEKKRRLILSDSEESDGFLISPRPKLASGDQQNGRVVVSDVGRGRRAGRDVRDAVERKRDREGSYDDVFEAESVKYVKRNTKDNGGEEEMWIDSVDHGDKRSKKIKRDKVSDSRPAVPPDKQCNGLNERSMQCKVFNKSKSSEPKTADGQNNGGNRRIMESKELDSDMSNKLEAADGQRGLKDRRIEAKKSDADDCGNRETADSDMSNKLEAADGQRGLKDRRIEAKKSDADDCGNRETADGVRDDSEAEASDRQCDAPRDGRIIAKRFDSDGSNEPETADRQKNDAEAGNVEAEYVISNKSHKPENSDKEGEVVAVGSIEGETTDLNKSGKLEVADWQKDSPMSRKIEAQQTELVGPSKCEVAKLDNPADRTTEAKKIGSTKFSKLETADRQRNKVGSTVSDSKKLSKLKTEKDISIQHSSQRTLKTLKGGSTHSICVKRKDHSISKQKNAKMQGKCGVWKDLCGKKKASGPGKGGIVREDGEARNSLCSSSIAYQNMISKQSSVSGEREVLIKSAPSKNRSDVRKSVQKCRSDDTKSERVILSSKKNLKCRGSPNTRENMASKVEDRTSSKAPLLKKQKKEAPSAVRRTARQKLREQIKSILLDSGWKIDLRPRRGRNYEDNVYISPEGRGYWSITKAYAMFQEKLPCAHEGKRKELSANLLKKSGGNCNLEGPSSPISMDVLNILKRKTVKKRNKKEPEETPVKIGDRKRRLKARQTTDDIGRRKKLKSSNISSMKNSVAFTDQKPHILQRNNSNKRGCALLVRGANQEAESDDDDYVPYVWKRSVLSWLIDLGILPINGMVKYMNKRRTRAILEGRITRDGIHCNCCSKILSVSKFELHAGSKLQQPYENIYVDKSGPSLLQCQLNAWETQESSERQGFYSVDVGGDDPNDDTCGICGDGGDLICCDGCPSTFHLNCLGIKVLPPGDWHCANCSCKFCRVASGCCPQGSGETAQLLCCSLCEEKYHKNCVPEVYALRRVSNNAHTSFCGRSCGEVFKGLQKLIGAKNDLEAGFSWSVICRFDEDSAKHHFELPRRAECNSKIAVALAVMDECFLPITDERSGINLIHNVVYNCGSNFSRLNYSGFYTFVLERGDEIISVASIRIHGTRLAEMPFIGTRNMYRRQGMCRRLLMGIESALSSLNIEKLIIPAISELTDTWTTIFGFKPLDSSERQEVRYVNLLVFPGTGLLQKTLLTTNSTEHHSLAIGVDKAEPKIEDNCTPDLANQPTLVSSVGPEPPASDESIVHCKSEVKDIDCNICTFDKSVNTSKLPLGSSNDSHGSQFQAHKFTENASDADLSLKPQLVYNGPLVGEELLVNVSNDTKFMCPHDGTVDGNHKMDNEEVPEEHISEAKCTSPDASASNLLDCNGSNLHLPVCSRGLETDGVHLDRSEVASLSCSSVREQQGSQAIPATDFQISSGTSGYQGSETSQDTVDSVVNEPHTPLVDSKLCADKDTETGGNDVKAKRVPVRSEYHINHIVAAQDAFEVSRVLNVAFGKEGDTSLKSVASDFDVATEKVSTFAHTPKASDNACIQQDLELTKKELEYCIPAEFHCNNAGLINPLPPSSPKKNSSSNGVVLLQKKAQNGRSSIKQDPDAVNNDFEQHASDLVGDESLDLVAKHPPAFVPEVSVLSESVSLDASSAPVLTISVSSAHLVLEVDNAVDVASDCIVQHEVATADARNTVVPAEPNHVCGNRGTDTSFPQGEFAVVKLGNEFGCSSQSTLGMICESASDSNEAIIQQHNTEFPSVFHASASGVADPFADGTNNSEMHNVVNRCRQAVCVVDSTKSVD
ncbi:hypothetical protein J5N97_027527 [Dioscorea zingiberensis]|uniref:PHD-type domain-containing protein n=1 Tax=Dioscorea zingiberensis TaxID=325984 RepID=A0A9D5C5H5_9LILI|nr:hypothetical protein J5N97_027527 [Dioscorea zingiberensis]